MNFASIGPSTSSTSPFLLHHTATPPGPQFSFLPPTHNPTHFLVHSHSQPKLVFPFFTPPPENAGTKSSPSSPQNPAFKDPRKGLEELFANHNPLRWKWKIQDQPLKWLLYDPRTQEEIEAGRRKKLQTFEVYVFSTGARYIIDLLNLTQRNKETNTVRQIMCEDLAPKLIDFRPIMFLDQHRGSEFTKYWVPELHQANFSGKLLTCGIAELTKDRHDVEWSFVESKFKETMHHRTITRILRVQNRRLQQEFFHFDLRLKDELEEQGRSTDMVTYRWLFHGTKKPENVPKIANGGFDKRYADHDHNLNAFGKGCYFSTSAKYSDSYACEDVQDHNKVLFLAQVIVGEYAVGKKQQPVPPEKEDTKVLAHYDTTVDKLAYPSIFVTYSDGQAYPTYLIFY